MVLKATKVRLPIDEEMLTMNYGAEYEMMNSRGTEQLKNGAFSCWAGVSTAHHYKPFVAALLSADTSTEGLLAEIGLVAQATGVDLYLAVRDFQLHMVHWQGLRNVTAGSFNAQSLPDQAPVSPLMFEHFAIGPSGILCSVSAPSQVTVTRAAIRHTVRNLSLEGRVPDIVHTTAYRIIGYKTRAGLQEFAKEMMILRSEIKDSPVSLAVHSLYWGTVGTFFNRGV